MSFRRKLRALQFPKADTFDVKDELQTRVLIVWLEEQVIRWYPKAKRIRLRAVDSETWNKTALVPYLKELQLLTGVPDCDKAGPKVVEALVAHAVRLAYNDNAVQYSQVRASPSLEQQQPQPQKPVLEELVSQDAVKEALCRLAEALHLPAEPSPSHQSLLRASVSRLEELLRRASDNNKLFEGLEEQARDIVTNMPLGFEIADEKLSEAGQLLRVLYMQDLRRLQGLINETIVLAQEYTANPRADPRLGEVGRGG